MSALWCFVEELSAPGVIALTADEVRHVSARRLRAGDALVLFDGRGHFAEAQVESIDRRSTVVVCEAIQEAPRPDAGVMLASAIPKGDRLSTMLQMLTQLGVSRWQPLVLDESVVRKLDVGSPRLSRILIESCKVSRRAWRLDVAEPCSLDEVLASRPSDVGLYFGDRLGESGGLGDAGGWFLVGPEAGFSEAERRALARAGAHPVSLGPYNLRIETAMVAAAAAFHGLRTGAGRPDGAE